MLKTLAVTPTLDANTYDLLFSNAPLRHSQQTIKKKIVESLIKLTISPDKGKREATAKGFSATALF